MPDAPPIRLDAIPSLPDGTPLARVTGVVVSVEKYRHDVKDGKPWSAQKLEIMSPEGARATVKVRMHPEIPVTAVRRQVEFVAGQKANGGTKGVFIKDDEYPTGTITHLVMVNENAQILWPQQGSAPPPTTGMSAPSPAPVTHGPPPQVQPQAQHPPVAAGKTNQTSGIYFGAPLDATLIRKNIHRLARLMIYCHRATTYVQETRTREGHPLSEGQLQGMTASLFIEANRKDLIKFVPDMEPPPVPTIHPPVMPSPPPVSVQPPPEEPDEEIDVPF